MRYVFLFLLVLLAIPVAHSMRMTPPSAEISFAPSMQGEFDIILTNNRAHPISTNVEIEGTLGRYFTATNPDLRSRGSAASTVTFAFPEDIPPGEHRVYITYSEDFFDENAGITARTGVRFIAKIWKPYPGQFAELSVRPQHVPAGQDTDAELVIRSRGEQAVSGDVQVRVYDGSGKLMDSEALSRIEVAGDSQWSRFILIRSRDYPPGRYSVQATYDYGSARTEAESTLIIGVRDIDVLNVTQNFYLDVPVNPFSVDVESLWNEPIEGVEASFQLGQNTGRTPTIILNRFSQKSLDGFWTTDATLEPGVYNALVTVLFRDGEPVTRSYPVTVHATTPQPPREEEPASIVIGLTDLIFILVVLIIIGFVMMKVYGHHKGESIEV